jgi:site-specific recombinase XerD
MLDVIVDLLEVYTASLRGEGKREATIDRYRRALVAFAHWLDESATVDDVTEQLVIDYRDELAALGASERTRALTLSAIRSFCRWCVASKRRKDDPTLLVKWPRLPDLQPKALDGGTLQRLHEALAAFRTGHKQSVWLWRRNRRAIYLMLYAGLRRGEAARLLWRDVDLVNGVLTVRSGKGNKDRCVPLHPVLWDELELINPKRRIGAVAGHSDGRSIDGKTLGHMCDRWLPGLGVEGVSCHALRHSFATELRRGGSDLKDIQDLLGHESLATTEIYLGPDPERLRSAVNRLPGPGAMGKRDGAGAPGHRLRIVS